MADFNGFKDKIILVIVTAAVTGITGWVSFVRDVATRHDIALINTRIDNLVIAVSALTK